MTYARKTCHCCGMVKPVNLMQQVQVKVEVGHTKDKLTAGTIAGALLFDNKASKRRINRRVFANNKRSHYRTRMKYECYPGTCHMPAKEAANFVLKAEEERIAAANAPLSAGDWVILGGLGLALAGALYGTWQGTIWVLNEIVRPALGG